MAKKSETRSDYLEWVSVARKDQARILASEHMWDILEYVHSKPEGVRPEEIAKEFDIQPNQAYDKLRTLEKEEYLIRTKQKGKPGRGQERRKSLLYISSIWGDAKLEEDFADILVDKYGDYVMKNIAPQLCEFYEHVLSDMQKDREMLKWYPRSHTNLCPHCGQKHQAIELFNALLAFCNDIVQAYSYVYNKKLLDHGYITRKDFEDDTRKEKDDPDWALSDRTEQ